MTEVTTTTMIDRERSSATTAVGTTNPSVSISTQSTTSSTPASSSSAPNRGFIQQDREAPTVAQLVQGAALASALSWCSCLHPSASETPRSADIPRAEVLLHHQQARAQEQEAGELAGAGLFGQAGPAELDGSPVALELGSVGLVEDR